MALPIDDLLERISAALHLLPGAVELYLFGSAADPAAKDPYSDLDLQVLCAEYPLSLATWPGIHCQAGEIEMAYPFASQAHEQSFCIVFANESLYHKVDIGICDRDSSNRLFDQIGKKVLLWKQPAKTVPINIEPGEMYSPEIGSPDHFLFGELISSVRYVKARKRDQHLTCWRFLSAKFNALLRCYRWQAASQKIAESPLTTWDFTALDQQMPESERLRLLKSIDLNTPEGMDAAMNAITRQIANHIYPDYPGQDSLPARMIRKYLAFLEYELRK